MRIHVGSKNAVKIQSVTDALALYPKLFPHPEIVGIDVDVPEFGHPKNIKETVTGAIERAKKAFTDCDYSFGIEGGLLAVPFTESGFMETGACAVYDGSEIYLGLGPAFEWPAQVTELIISGKADASKAFKELGLTKQDKLGSVPGGISGILTNGRLTREEFTKYSIIMALIKIENVTFYEKK
jgi:inosine/xanthosine triphosphatase